MAPFPPPYTPSWKSFVARVVCVSPVGDPHIPPNARQPCDRWATTTSPDASLHNRARHPPARPLQPSASPNKGPARRRHEKQNVPKWASTKRCKSVAHNPATIGRKTPKLGMHHGDTKERKRSEPMPKEGSRRQAFPNETRRRAHAKSNAETCATPRH